MKDANHDWWMWASDETWFWTWYGNGPYEAPFSFGILLSDGSYAEGYNVISDRNEYSSGTITYDESFTYEDNSTYKEEMHWTATAAIVIGTLCILSLICIAAYCCYKRKKQKAEVTFKTGEDDSKRDMVGADTPDPVLPNDGDNQEAGSIATGGYDMSNIDQSENTPEQEDEITVDVEVQS